MMAGTGHRAWLRWTIAPLAVAAALGATVASAQSLTTDTPQVLGDVAVQANPDGAASLVTTGADFLGADLLVGQADGKRTLTMRDGQHTYVYAKD